MVPTPLILGFGDGSGEREGFLGLEVEFNEVVGGVAVDQTENEFLVFFVLGRDRHDGKQDSGFGIGVEEGGSGGVDQLGERGLEGYTIEVKDFPVCPIGSEIKKIITGELDKVFTGKVFGVHVGFSYSGGFFKASKLPIFITINISVE